jgi:hypothetical protein
VGASSSSLISALLQEHADHASLDSAGNDSSASSEAVDASSKGDEEKGHSIKKAQSESQQSDKTGLLCMQNAATSKFRALVDPTEEIQTSIEQLTSMHLDVGHGQPSVSASTGTWLPRLPKGSSSFAEAMCSSQHGSNSVGSSMVHDGDALWEGKGPPKDGGDEGTSTCNSINADSIRWQASMLGLLGESAQVSQAVHEALKEIEDVHSSDELMHFEFFGPFWELSEV